MMGDNINLFWGAKGNINSDRISEIKISGKFQRFSELKWINLGASIERYRIAMDKLNPLMPKLNLWDKFCQICFSECGTSGSCMMGDNINLFWGAKGNINSDKISEIKISGKFQKISDGSIWVHL